MSLPVSYKEEVPYQNEWDFSSEDKAVADLVASAFVDDERPLPIVFATPERAFALVRRKFNISENQPVPLPIVSIQQVGEAAPDRTRRLSPGITMRVGEIYDSDGTLTHAVTMQWPLPYDFLYQIELWVKNRGDARRLLGQYADLFPHADYGYLPVQYGGGMGLQLVRMENQGIVDNTQLETGKEQRSLRWTCNLLVHGWRPRRTKKVPVVRRFDISVEHVVSKDVSSDSDTDLLEPWTPLIKGSMKTGQIVWDNGEFSDDYSGVDHRRKSRRR